MIDDYLRDCTECGKRLSHDEANELSHGTYCDLHAAEYDYE